ncbi:FecR family protein [Pedobacter insulae]|uniref:FecR protein n=1 Tax=Pedobacter insulae TaxID=414048 RepID=A0A1I2VUH3_9SPHI|nr:FecR family protein [Pedobacter insulae]SFG92007.1 FecR protein [Pedobacter insulae]
MDNIDAKNLLIKYREGACTPEEITLIESWYLNDKEEDIAITIAELDEAKDHIWATLPVHDSLKAKQVRLWLGLPRRYIRIAAAAIIVLSASVGLYFSKQKTNKEDVVAAVNNNIVPGGKKALLTLANGQSIVLGDARNGKLADQANSSVFKTANGELVYNAENRQEASVVYNLLTIPRGGYYILTLADGTKVWLNAESSLKYPTSFIGSERVVELVGEGYFEVAKRKDQPFKVVTSQQTVEVLGTHFNVNAYADEKVTATTLLEGSVKVSLSSRAKLNELNTAILKPHQQAVLKNGNIVISPVNAEEAVAWVNNNFNFNKEDLGSIMRKISRWYDVEVVCPDDLEQMEFIGTVSRTKNIKDVINIIEQTNAVHLKVEGRRITVMH